MIWIYISLSLCSTGPICQVYVQPHLRSLQFLLTLSKNWRTEDESKTNWGKPGHSQMT